MVAQAGSAEQAMPKELTLDGEGRLALGAQRSPSHVKGGIARAPGVL